MQLRLRRVDETIVSRLAGALRVRPATARCLVARGVIEPRDAQGFIDPRLAALRPPAGLAGLARAVGRIADAVVQGERIGVFGDYDVDGVTTAALLTAFLRSTGATVEVAVARRDAGYGFTAAAACDFAARRRLRLHRRGGLRLRGARLPHRHHRRLRHQRPRGDRHGRRARDRRDRRRSPHRARRRRAAPRAVAGQSVPGRLDISVSRHGVGGARVLCGRRGADRAARAAVL